MKRMVGRRVVEEGALKMAWLVTVKKRWGKDEYYSEEIIGVTLSESPRSWVTVTSKQVPSRSRV